MTAELNRKLHAAMTELVGKEKAHEALHVTIENMGKRSLADLSDKEALLMLNQLEKEKKARGKQISGALDQPTPISEKQLKYITDMIRELDWSENYVSTVLKNRFGIYDRRLEMLPSFIAIRLIELLKERVEKKRKTVVE